MWIVLFPWIHLPHQSGKTTIHKDERERERERERETVSYVPIEVTSGKEQNSRPMFCILDTMY
jgi:hypothetical protein